LPAAAAASSRLPGFVRPAPLLGCSEKSPRQGRAGYQWAEIAMITEPERKADRPDGALIERHRQSDDWPSLNRCHSISMRYFGGPPVGSPLTPLIPLRIASNLGALSCDLLLIRRNRLEIDMTLFSSTILSWRVPMQGRQNSSEIDFGIWASIVLIGLAIVSVASGVAPVVDPTIFPAP